MKLPCFCLSRTKVNRRLKHVAVLAFCPQVLLVPAFHRENSLSAAVQRTFDHAPPTALSREAMANDLFSIAKNTIRFSAKARVRTLQRKREYHAGYNFYCTGRNFPVFHAVLAVSDSKTWKIPVINAFYRTRSVVKAKPAFRKNNKHYCRNNMRTLFKRNADFVYAPCNAPKTRPLQGFR